MQHHQFLLLLVCFSSIGFCGCHQPAPPPTGEWTKVEIADSGFTCQFPGAPTRQHYPNAPDTAKVRDFADTYHYENVDAEGRRIQFAITHIRVAAQSPIKDWVAFKDEVRMELFDTHVKINPIYVKTQNDFDARLQVFEYRGNSEVEAVYFWIHCPDSDALGVAYLRGNDWLTLEATIDGGPNGDTHDAEFRAAGKFLGSCGPFAEFWPDQAKILQE